MTELLDLAGRVVALADGRSDLIVTVRQRASALTRFANSRIHQNVAEDVVRVAVKAVVDGRVAGSSTTRTDDESLRRLVESAIGAATLRPPDADWPGLARPAPVGAGSHDVRTAQATPDDRAAIVEAFVAAGGGLEAAGFCATESCTTAFANSAGQRIDASQTSARLHGIHRTSESDGLGFCFSVRLDDVDGEAAGRTAASKARSGDGAVELEPGQYEVVLEPSCVANILQFLGGSGFNARSFADGTSFVAIGNRQFDAAVNLWDDATDPRTTGVPFDAEGTPSRRVDLVRDGVTTAVVHDRRTAAKAGTESTGHATGSDAFGPMPSSMFLAPGSRSREELIASVARGLLVTDFNYTRILDPKTQVVTGLTRNGLFLIEDGRVIKPVKNFRFTQSYVGALAPGRVLGIGADACLYGGAFVPSLHLASWNFTGGARG
jgi:predicted Zn-dependent protease